MQNLKIITTNLEVMELLKYLEDKQYIAVDCETTGVVKGSQIIGYSVCADDKIAFYVILYRWDVPSNSLIPLETIKTATLVMETLVNKDLIGHNFIFDATMIKDNFKISLIESLHTDTMLLAHLLDENRRVGLKELAKTLFGEDSTLEQQHMKDSVFLNGGVLTKTAYEMYKADAHLMAKYGAKDALLTYRLFIELVSELYEQGLDKFFYEDESMPLLKGPTYQLNTTGLKVDQQALADLKKQLEIECLEAKTFIYAEIAAHIKDKYPGTNKKNTFNIGSSTQLAWLMFGQLGLEFSTLTKEGKKICKHLGLRLPYTAVAKRDFISVCQKSLGDTLQPASKVNGKDKKAKKIREVWNYIACDKSTLKKLAPRYEWIKRLLEYQSKTKILTTYVKGIETRLQYGILQGSFLQHGTTSGRYASRNPNMQNMPRDDKRIKECLVARPGKVFVGSDFSQLEVRVFASVSGDPDLLESFKSGHDFYSVVGMTVFNKTDCTPFKGGSNDAFGIKYENLRKAAKEIALASVYGASAWQLMSKTGKSEKDTQQDIDSYFESFPKVKEMMLKSHVMAKETGQVTSIYGRPRHLPDAKKINKIYGNVPHGELPYEARSLLNLSCNHRIQSTAASVCNRSMIAFYNMVKKLEITECYIVSQIHDEIIVECKEEDAETVSILLQEAMENAVVLPGVKLEAIPTIAKNIGKLK